MRGRQRGLHGHVHRDSRGESVRARQCGLHVTIDRRGSREAVRACQRGDSGPVNNDAGCGRRARHPRADGRRVFHHRFFDGDRDTRCHVAVHETDLD